MLTTFLSVQNVQVGFADSSKEAKKHISKALYIELKIDKAVKRLEKRYTPKWAIKYGPYILTGYKMAIEKRVSYTWRF